VAFAQGSPVIFAGVEMLEVWSERSHIFRPKVASSPKIRRLVCRLRLYYDARPQFYSKLAHATKQIHHPERVANY
jgi:hypothetical protein